MKIDGHNAQALQSRPVVPTARPEDAVDGGPKTPNPLLDGTAEGGPPRGGMRAIFAGRRPVDAEPRVHDAPGQRTFASRKAMVEVKHAVKNSVDGLLESGELTEAQADAVRELAGDLRASLRTARRSIEPGDISTAHAAFEQIGDAVDGFFAAVDEIVGIQASPEPDLAVDNEVVVADSADPEIAVPTDDASPEIVAPTDDADTEVVVAGDATDPEIVVPEDDGASDGPTAAYAMMKQTISDAVEGYLDSLQGRAESQSNPFAGVYEAVAAVTDPTAEVVSAAITTV